MGNLEKIVFAKFEGKVDRGGRGIWHNLGVLNAGTVQ